MSETYPNVMAKMTALMTIFNIHQTSRNGASKIEVMQLSLLLLPIVLFKF